MSDPAGKILAGRYKLAEQIGRGVTGTAIFKAEDVQTGQSVSVKILFSVMAGAGEALERLRKEASEAWDAGQSGVARFVDAGTDPDGTSFIVSEYLEGESLARVLEREVILNYKKLFSYIVPVCETLDAVHERGIIHRDLKPENIFVCAAAGGGDTIKILDFGMACLWESSPAQPSDITGLQLVHPHYLAPEQIRKGDKIDPRTDLYALGVVMYQAIVGRVPFEGETFDAIKAKILAQQPQQPREINADISEEINSLIMCTVDKDPDMRFQRAGELVAIIKNLLEVLAPAESNIDEESLAGREGGEAGVSAKVSRPGLLAGDSAFGAAAERPEDLQRAVDDLRGTLESAPGREERMKAGRSLAAIYENKLFDTDSARKVYLLLLEIDGDAPEVLDELDRIYMINLDWPALLDILDRKGAKAGDEAARAELLTRKGEILSKQVGDLPGAMEALRKVVDELDVTNRPALEELRLISMQMGRWEDYVEILGRLISLSDADAKVRLYEDLADTWVERFSNVEKAKEAYRSILKIQPDNTIVAALLEDLSRPEALEGEPTVPGAPFPEPPGREVQPPKPAEEPPRPAAEEPMALKQFVFKEAAPEPPPPVIPEEIPAAPPVLVRPQIAPPPPPPPAPRPAPAPAPRQPPVPGAAEEPLPPLPQDVPVSLPLLEQAAPPARTTHAAEIDWIKEVEDPAAMVQELLDKYESMEDKDTRCELLIMTAQLYEVALWDDEAAFLLYQKAYFENYNDPVLVEELERITAKIGKWDELIGAVNEKITELGNRIEAVPLYLHAGKWYTERLGHVQYAMAVFAKAYQIDPQSLEVLSAIADLYRLMGQWDSYIHYLKIQIEKARTDEVRKKILVKLGKTYQEDLKRADQAMETFRKVLSIDPMSDDALGALESIYREYGMVKDLADILQRRVRKLDRETEPAKVVQMLLSIGQLYETNLQDPMSAAQCYRKIIEIDGSNMTALHGLERVFTGLEQVSDLLDVLEMQLGLSSIEKERVDLLKRIAAMVERDLLRPDLAREKYELILSMDPDNEHALENLERLYRGQKNWTSLVEILDRHVMVAADEEKKIRLCLEAGQILMDEMKTLERAVETYRGVLDLNPRQPEALRLLADLYEQLDNPADAYKSLEMLARATEAPAERADILYRMGVLLDARLGRREEAASKLREVLEIVPNHLESLGALRTIYFELQQWDQAARMIDLEQGFTTDPVQRSELLYARGRILLDHMGRTDEAIEYFKQALECSTDNDEAARPLSRHYIENERWEDAQRLLELIVLKGAGRKDKKELLPYFMDLASVSVVLGEDQKAIAAFKGALEIDGTRADAIKGLAEALYRTGDWADSFKHYTEIIKSYPDSQTTKEKIEIYHRLGDIKLKQNEPRKAMKLFEAILEIDRHHQPTLVLLADIFSKHEDYEQVVYFKKLLTEVVGPEQQKALFEEIGDIWQEKLRNSIKAISMYNEALKLDRDNRNVLHKLMSLYSDTKQWAKAVEVIKHIAQIEDDLKRRSRFYGSIAIIYQSEVKEFEAAIEYLNKALDLDPDNLKNFEAIEKILTPMRDWKSLEKNYRVMIHRIRGTGNTVLEENLLHNLGEIYRTRLKNYEAAAETFKLASSFSPGNVERHEILAELYQLLPDRWTDAVAEFQFLLRKNPDKIDAYKALRKLYQDTEQYDKSYCLCAALTMMNQADENERAFYEYYRKTERQAPQQSIDNERWIKNVFHPFEDVYVGKIFEIVAPVIFKRKVQPQKVYNLKKKDRRDPMAGPEPVVRAFGMAGKVLGLLLPEIYVSMEQAAPIQYAVTDPPASVIGAALAAGNFPPQDLLFFVAKHLTYYRGEHYVRLLEPTAAGLTTLLLSGVRIGDPYFPMAPDIEKQVAPVVQVLRKELAPLQLEQLGKVVKGFTGSKASVDMKKWVSSVELTACRAGLVVCNDLEAALRVLGAEPLGLSDLSPREKIKELILFACSEEYFRLREMLEVGIRMV